MKKSEIGSLRKNPFVIISEEKGKRGSRIVTLYALIFLPYIVFFDLLFTLI
jgi:hypothetical protein